MIPKAKDMRCLAAAMVIVLSHCLFYVFYTNENTDLTFVPIVWLMVTYAISAAIYFRLIGGNMLSKKSCENVLIGAFNVFIGGVVALCCYMASLAVYSGSVLSLGVFGWVGFLVTCGVALRGVYGIGLETYRAGYWAVFQERGFYRSARREGKRAPWYMRAVFIVELFYKEFGDSYTYVNTPYFHHPYWPWGEFRTDEEDDDDD